MQKTTLIGIIVLAAAAVAAAQEQGKPPAKHVHRWESNLSLGYINYQKVENPPVGYVDTMNRHIAIVKSFWFYPFMPRIVSLGLSFDYVTDDLPLSANIALNLPTKTIVPFVSAGAGFSFSGNTLKNFGGGLKFRTGEHFGLVAEYRHYTVRKKSQGTGMGEVTVRVTRVSNYFGMGIAYLY